MKSPSSTIGTFIILFHLFDVIFIARFLPILKSVQQPQFHSPLNGIVFVKLRNFIRIKSLLHIDEINYFIILKTYILIINSEYIENIFLQCLNIE